MDCCSGTPEVPTMVVTGGAAVATPVACRWNPTKEHINMLESLYVQGLRTPTAEQIQKITGRLQAYGHVEDKNVFYWFQNHKARQRQKEKQDRLSLFGQYNHLHRHHSMSSFMNLCPPSKDVYKPCYMPQNKLGFYAHQQEVVSPSTTTRQSRPTKKRSPQFTRQRSTAVARFKMMHKPENDVADGGGSNMTNIEQVETVINGKNYSHQETLDLFPLHPTGILQKLVRTTGSGSCLASRACTLR